MSDKDLSFSKRLQQFFSIGVEDKKDSTKSAVYPVDDTKEVKEKDPLPKLNFPTEVQKLWDWYLDQTADTSGTLKNRMDRYDDLDYMLYNDTVISMAADLYADEASQADVQTEPIFIKAKKPAVRNTIKGLFQQWGIDQTYVRETAWNIAYYGDSFDINVFSKENGIEEVVPQDVRAVVERMEFKTTEIQKKMRGKAQNFLFSDPRLKALATEIKADSSDKAKYFKSYLLGFQLATGDYLAPWAVNHYRNFSRRSEFWPYGRSLFIYSIGPFRQLKTSKNLMALSRALKFPKDKYEVKVSEGMTEIEQWDAVNDARQEFHNMGVLNKNKDDFSVGAEIWVPEGLISHESIESNLRIEDIADIELLRDDLIMGTRIPKGYLVVDRGTFGTSGQSLLQQFKPFGRAVYSIQSVILEQLSKLVKMHFLMTGEFDKEETEFELGMNFPVVEEASDRLRMKSDTLRLAGDVISAIQNALGTRDGLPPDVVEMIFSKLSFLEPEEVKEIINKSVKGLDLGDTDEEGSSKNLYDSKKSMNEKIRSRINEDIIYDAYFEAANKRGLQEGVMNSRHFMMSNKTTLEQSQLFNLLRR
jgi:hypothetical protein